MISLLRTRRFLLFAAIALLVPVLAACSTGDDDDDADTATDEVATEVTDAAPDAEAEETEDVEITPETEGDETPETGMTAEADEEETGTPDSMTTPDADTTPEMDADETSTVEGTAEADETPDTADADETPGTADADETPGMGMVDDPFGDLADVTVDVPNYSLEFTGTFENVPDETGETFSTEMEMMVEQSAPDVYHLRLMTTGDQPLEIEVWSLEDATYIAEGGGEPTELPAGVATEIVPAQALMIVPPLELLEAAEETGEEEINGRTATHYEVSAEEAALVLLTQGVTVSNPEGGMDIWIDEELGIALQMTADLTFENEDGSEGSIQMEYMVSDIEETDDIEAPTS